MCGAYGHIYENCFLLEKTEQIEHAAGMNVLPIEEMSDDDWVADECEAPL